MRLVQRMVGLDRGDEFDGHETSALVQQLEHRMLCVGADPAPGDRCGGLVDRRSVGLHALAVRLHLQLLEIGRQQAQPLVIGEGRARLGALLAFYEQRTFANAVLLGINPFDQFGVELGKEIARSIESEGTANFDPSTRALIARALG